MGCTIENDLGLVFLDCIIDNLGISVCGVLFKKRILNHVNLLSTVLEAFLSKVVNLVTNENCTNLCILGDVLSKLTAFADELKSYVLDLAMSLLSIYPDVLVILESVVAGSCLYFLDSAESASGKALVTEGALSVYLSNSAKLVSIIGLKFKCVIRAGLEAQSATCTFFF